MDYIQLEIGGKLRGLKFANMTYREFYKYFDQTRYDETFHYAAIYAALWMNAYRKREDFTETYETVCDWVDAMSDEDKGHVLNAFNSTEYWQDLVEKGKEIAEQITETPDEKKSESTPTMTSV